MNSNRALILRDWTHIRCKPDLKIEGKSGKYLCHRIVILCLSPYFHKLFQYRRQSGDGYYTLDMTDIETSSLLSIINFAYKSVLDVNEDNVEDLLISADKYNIMSIMNRCQRFLWQSLDVHNCLDIYLLAHFYNCHRLRDGIKKFIVDHKLIRGENGWKTGLSYSDLTDDDIIREWHRRRDNESGDQ